MYQRRGDDGPTLLIFPAPAFKGCMAALQKKEWRGAVGQLTRESQQLVAGFVLLLSGMDVP